MAEYQVNRAIIIKSASIFVFISCGNGLTLHEAGFVNLWFRDWRFVGVFRSLYMKKTVPWAFENVIHNDEQTSKMGLVSLRWQNDFKCNRCESRDSFRWGVPPFYTEAAHDVIWHVFFFFFTLQSDVWGRWRLSHMLTTGTYFHILKRITLKTFCVMWIVSAKTRRWGRYLYSFS